MNIEAYRDYCLSKKATNESFPFDKFDKQVLVFKVLNKMFAVTRLNSEEFIAYLKCDPERAIQLREKHPESITDEGRMGGKHWNAVYFERGLEEAFLKELIDHSYDLVVKNLKKSDRELLAKM